MSINKAILIGNVGKQPDIRATNNGKEIAIFSLATSESWKDKQTGERKERTEWHRIVVYSQGLVGIIKNYVNKGSKLYIEGTIRTRKYNNSKGDDVYTTEIILDGYSSILQLLDSKKDYSNKNIIEDVKNNFPDAEIESEEEIDEIPF